MPCFDHIPCSVFSLLVVVLRSEEGAERAHHSGGLGAHCPLHSSHTGSSSGSLGITMGKQRLHVLSGALAAQGVVGCGGERGGGAANASHASETARGSQDQNQARISS